MRFHSTLGFLKINRKAKSKAGSAKIVKTLSQMLVRKVVDALQLDHKNIFHENVSKVLANQVAFVSYGKRSLSGGSNASNAKFGKQCPFIDLLQKSNAQCV